MEATTAPRPQAAAPRRRWTSKSLSLVMAGLVLSGYSATVLMRVMEDSPKTHGGCCDGLDCSLPCLKNLPIDVRAAQTALDYVNEHSEFGEAVDETDLVDLSEACVFEADKGRELGTKPGKPFVASEQFDLREPDIGRTIQKWADSLE